MKYSGIDLHSNNSVVTVTDEEDRVVAEKRLPNDLAKIVELLMPWQEELAGVVVESTFNWYWLVDGLKEAGFTVHLANTTAIKKYDGLKHSGDEADARYLAHLLRLGILPTGTTLAPEHRAVRDLARKRMQLVRSRTSHILAVENITARQNGVRISSNQVKRLTTELVDEMALPPDVALAVKANAAVITTLSAQIDLLEKRLQANMKERSEYGLLTSVPGIGQVLATTILLETGPIERFAGAGNFASYARCVDSVRTSNGKKKGEGNTKNGNKYLAWAFIEAANFAMRFNAEAKRFYERKKAKTNNVVAIKALAHKLARACFHILKERKPFDVMRCFAGVTTVAGKPGNATGVAADGSEWDAVPPSPVCSKADRPRREPEMDWRRCFGSHGSVMNHWTRFGTNVLLGRRSRQGDRQRHRRSLDPDGCLARFVAAKK